MNLIQGDLEPNKFVTCIYYPEKRQFRTTDGHVILNLYPLVPPYIIQVFLYKQVSMVYENPKYHFRVNLLYSRKKQ